MPLESWFGDVADGVPDFAVGTFFPVFALVRSAATQCLKEVSSVFVAGEDRPVCGLASSGKAQSLTMIDCVDDRMSGTPQESWKLPGC